VGTAADLALDGVTAGVPARSRWYAADFRPLEDGEQFGLIGGEPQQRAIECGEAVRRQKMRSKWVSRRGAIGRQIGIKPNEPAMPSAGPSVLLPQTSAGTIWLMPDMNPPKFITPEVLPNRYAPTSVAPVSYG
jgi:hypothetical protein